ncbi:MAG: hypothetical protein ISR98_01665 [Parcubacteria group bacterium]|nr:hypothetical protein [Parcubacteria group bacterium]
MYYHIYKVIFNFKGRIPEPSGIVIVRTKSYKKKAEEMAKKISEKEHDLSDSRASLRLILIKKTKNINGEFINTVTV